MPPVNIPPRIRFALYIIGALALATISYALDKGWVGKPEVQYVSTLAALLATLAAAKTDLSQPPLEEVLNDEAREQLAERREVDPDPAPPAGGVRRLLDEKGL